MCYMLNIVDTEISGEYDKIFDVSPQNGMKSRVTLDRSSCIVFTINAVIYCLHVRLFSVYQYTIHTQIYI